MSQGFSFARADGGQESIVPAAQTTLVSGASRLTSGLNKVTPVAGSTAVLLPKNQPVGAPIVVQNLAATAVTLLVFPPYDDGAAAAAGGKINNGSADASFSVAQNKVAVFYPHANGIDYAAVLSA